MTLNSKHENLISEFMNPMRINILKLLSLTPASFTDLAKKFDISNSEVSRHCSRLEQHGFIKKELREYKLTSFGGLVLTLFSPIEFIFNKSDYFREHNIDDLSLQLIRNIFSLIDCELIEGTGDVMLKLQELADSALESFDVMTSQIFPFGKEGLDVSYLVTPQVMKMGKNTDVLNSNRSTQGRMLQKMPISIIIIDNKKGMIFFPNINNDPDFNSGFFASEENSTGFQYIKDIWNYYWDKAETTKNLGN